MLERDSGSSDLDSRARQGSWARKFPLQRQRSLHCLGCLAKQHAPISRLLLVYRVVS